MMAVSTSSTVAVTLTYPVNIRGAATRQERTGNVNAKHLISIVIIAVLNVAESVGHGVDAICGLGRDETSVVQGPLVSTARMSGKSIIFLAHRKASPPSHPLLP